MTFRTKLLASHVGLVVAVGVIAILTLNRWLTEDLARQLDLRLEEQAKGAVEWAAEGGRRHPEKVATRISHIVDAEVTLFDREGTVLGASTKEARGDVGDEVTQARAGGVGRASRVRNGKEMHTVAVKGEEGIVVRLAVPLDDIQSTVGAMRSRLLLASSVAVVVAIILGILASRIASRPLAEMTITATRLAQGDFDVPIDETSGDEFGVLWRALKSLAQQLKARVGDLVTERDQLSAILEGMVEGVLVVDAEGKVLVANPAVVAILGLGAKTPKALVGEPLGEVVAEPAARALIESGLRGDATGEDLELVDKRGNTLALYVRPLAAGGAVVAVVRDMTALRRLMTIRRDFVANVSHEIRTPVTAIQGYAETLLTQKGDDPAQRRQFLEIIHRQSQRIGALVEQLLALSEIEAKGRDDVRREDVLLVEVAGHVTEAVRGRAEARKVRLVVDVAPELVVRADPEGVERAVLNLVDNAIKYGREGGTVTIAAARASEGVRVTVSDDGPGIDAKHHGRLFERFYRIDPGRAREHGGAGLGLAIVKHLVESMDGAIAVDSEVGQGTRFAITLPAKA